MNMVDYGCIDLNLMLKWWFQIWFWSGSSGAPNFWECISRSTSLSVSIFRKCLPGCRMKALCEHSYVVGHLKCMSLEQPSDHPKRLSKHHEHCGSTFFIFLNFTVKNSRESTVKMETFCNYSEVAVLCTPSTNRSMWLVAYWIRPYFLKQLASDK